MTSTFHVNLVRVVVTGAALSWSSLSARGPDSQASDSTYVWDQVTSDAPFAPRDGAGALVFKERMWLLGGWNPRDKKHFPRICNNEVWSSENGSDWTLVKPNTFLDASFDAKSDWEGRHTAGYVVFKGKMWIVGGDANQGHYQNDIWNSADGRVWTRIADTVEWGPRVLHTTVVFDGKIWVIGGQTLPQFAAADHRFYDDVWNSTDGVDWQQVRVSGAPQPAPHWAPRGMIGGNVVFKGRVWLLGGGVYDTPKFPKRKFFQDVWSSRDGLRWTRHVEKAPWTPRQYHEVAVFDERMWLLEGWNQSNRRDVWHSEDGVSWREVPNTPWAPRHAASVFVYKDALWVVAGNNMQSDVWKLQRRESTGSP